MRKRIFIVLIIVSCFSLCVFTNKTYTSYESAVDNEVSVDVADWKIEIDGQDIATTTHDISLNNIVWENTHASELTAAPGSKGIVKIKIDPTTTQVAIKYNITYIDHTIDPDCILTVNNIYLEEEELLKVNDNTYSGVLTMNQIVEGTTRTLVIHVEWINDENNNEIDTQIGLDEKEPNYLKLEFDASQYTGE